MKMVDTIRTFCPNCNKHTIQKVKLYKKGKASPFSKGQLRHERKLKGYVGKVKGKKAVKKMGKHQKVILECTECKKKQERVIGTRTKKVLELIKKE
ncbi:MAG: 50S ribosomal protein L44e [Candidatus Micrarchaeota archaeon]|nr:50S ribosomal protein L44e [Candidatus Micrarchaeota archaeon]